jgi:hypothetical protein
VEPQRNNIQENEDKGPPAVDDMKSSNFSSAPQSIEQEKNPFDDPEIGPQPEAIQPPIDQSSLT